MIYPHLPEAIHSLEPNAHFRINGDFTFENITWEPHVDKAIIPTEQAIAQKANELEAAYPMVRLREERDKKLTDTDWWAMSDRTMTTEQKNYRQALRDIPANIEAGNLNAPTMNMNKRSADDTNIVFDWPEKP